MAKSKFLELGRSELLEPRLNAVLDGTISNFEVVSQRMMWYKLNGLYKEKYGDVEIDLSGKSDAQYRKFLKSIRGYIENKGTQKLLDNAGLSHLNEYWGLVRNAMNIAAKGRAIAYGNYSIDNMLVVNENRHKIKSNGLIAVICEKETVGKMWLKEMNRRGWSDKIIMIITQGFSSCEVIETLQEIREEIKNGETNFYVGVLNDMDISGIGIYEDIKTHFNALDLGINFEMLDRIDPNLWDRIKEPKKYKAVQVKTMKNYGLEDVMDRMGHFRLELDNLIVNEDINVFCDYAEWVIDNNCNVWDLNRISTPSASRPSELDDMEREVNEIWSMICQAALGVDDAAWSLNWTSCANSKKQAMIAANRNYKGNIEDAKNCRAYIRKQSRKLQKIVDNDPTNKERLAKLRIEVDKLGIEAIRERIEANSE